MCFYNENFVENEEEEDGKPESKPSKMWHENVLEYKETYINISYLAVKYVTFKKIKNIYMTDELR